MKGDFSQSALARRRYESATLQEGRVQMDADWNEKLDMRVNEDTIFLDIWEREVQAQSDDSVRQTAEDGSEADGRNAVRNEWRVRVVREVGVHGNSSFKVEFALDGVDSNKRRRSLAIPAPELCVEGTPWKRVSSFSGVGSTEKVYTLREDRNGTLRVEFGDGGRGERPRAGARVSASYRFGGGRAGDKDGSRDDPRFTSHP